jgi:hypothetical protein
MRTPVSIFLLSALIGCARTDARPANVERAPELATQPTSESLPMPRQDVGRQEETRFMRYVITPATRDIPGGGAVAVFEITVVED